MKKVVLLFPGQGSQSVGMGKSLFDQSAAAKQVFQAADAAIGIKITDLCFLGPEDQIMLTHNSQPAVTTVNLAVLAALKEKGIQPAATAGHSLGEYSALCAAGVFDVVTAVRLTRKRGELMQACADKNPGSMAAVIGLDMDIVAAICEETSQATGESVSIANYNSPQQVVITGKTAAVAAASAKIKEKGAKRVIELKVSGPWHSALLQDAQTAFAAVLAGESFGDPRIPTYANIDGTRKTTAADVKDALVRQVTGSVRWTQEFRALRADFPDAVYIECGPGKVLSGLVKAIDKDAVCYNISCADSLAATLAQLNA